MFGSRFWTPRMFDARHWAATGSSAVPIDVTGKPVAFSGFDRVAVVTHARVAQSTFERVAVVRTED